MDGKTTAPIDRAAVDAALAPFGRSRTLPAAAYTSEELFAWERRHFFEDSWVCAGRGSDVGEPGSQMAVEVGAEGVLVVRDGDGILRGFSNVCRHRGHQLLQTGRCAASKAIACPYHGWVYDLDGALRGAASFHDVPGFDRADFPLMPLPVTEWMGWIFINVSGRGPAFDDHVGNLADILGSYEPARLLPAATHDYVVEANWKIVAENYHECYHCSKIHPALCKVTPVDSG